MQLSHSLHNLGQLRIQSEYLVGLDVYIALKKKRKMEKYWKKKAIKLN